MLHIRCVAFTLLLTSSRLFVYLEEDSVFLLPKQEFDLSVMRTNITENVNGGPLALLEQQPDQTQRLSNMLRFRHALADEFVSNLRKNAGKAASASFELRIAPCEAAVLFGWPGLPQPTVKTKGAGSNSISFIVTAETILKPALPKELLVCQLDDPKVLIGLLGELQYVLYANIPALAHLIPPTTAQEPRIATTL
jgi:hypothetical protein